MNDFLSRKINSPRDFKDLQQMFQAQQILELLEAIADQRVLQMAREMFKPGDEVEINVPNVGWVRAKVVEDGDPDNVIVPDDQYGARIHIITHEPVVYSDALKREGFIPSFLIRPYESTEDLN